MEFTETKTFTDEVSVAESIKLLTDKENCDACDNSYTRFQHDNTIPDFYDDKKFKIGQQFYKKHLFAMFLGKFMGLLVIISTPNITNILTFTQKSGDKLSAYKRYLATIYHMCIWYDDEFKPNSRLWNSIAAVKKLHNSASNRSCAAGSLRILQKDMGITQFGFMGFALVRPELIGIHNYSQEEQEGFVHLWRVVGYVLGLKDRYNICRNSIEETKLICEVMIEKVFVPNIKTQNPDYLKLAESLINGMWVMMPVLETKSISMYTYSLLNRNLNNNETKIPEIQLNKRWYANFLQSLSIWLITYFPFLAFYAYGFKESYVSIHIGSK